MTRWFEFLLGVAFGLVASAPSRAQAPAVPGISRVSCEAKSTVTTLQSARFKHAFATSPEVCSSLNAVFSRLFSTSRPGGRKLEVDKPLNVAAAEQQRKVAQADPGFKAELAALLAGESDPLRQKFLEAALLHDLGHFLARDLLLQQLVASLGLEK